MRNYDNKSMIKYQDIWCPVSRRNANKRNLCGSFSRVHRPECTSKVVECLCDQSNSGHISYYMLHHIQGIMYLKLLKYGNQCAFLVCIEPCGFECRN